MKLRRSTCLLLAGLFMIFCFAGCETQTDDGAASQAPENDVQEAQDEPSEEPSEEQAATGEGQTIAFWNTGRDC